MMKKELTWEDFEAFVSRISARLKNSNNHFTAVSGIPRGGLPIAIRLSHELGIPFREYGERVAEDDFILMCDDVSDSGDTLSKIHGATDGTANMCFLAWFIKTDTKFVPNYYDQSIARDVWLVFPWERKDSEMKKDNEV